MNTRQLVALCVTLALGACATTAPPDARAPQGGAQNAFGSSVLQVRAAIVSNATAMLGQPYKFGGAAPGGFDCSGLVLYATDLVGLRLPRTAREQQSIGIAVARRNLRAGDLVFLHLARKELHVGIALDADRFVHAPSAGGRVRIDSLNAPPYAHSFSQGRRLSGSADTAAP